LAEVRGVLFRKVYETEIFIRREWLLMEYITAITMKRSMWISTASKCRAING